jgi:DNA-binding MarR family transcriptional regulator
VRKRIHRGDKRRSVLALSAKGWAIHDAVAPRARAHEAALLARLDAHERVCLARILDKLTEAGRAPR